MNQQNDPQNMIYNVLPTSTLAIISLVAGILGFTIFPVIGTVVALITGYMARQETRAIPPKASGDGLATAGIIMGYVHIGLFVLAICIVMVTFALIGGMVFLNRS